MSEPATQEPATRRDAAAEVPGPTQTAERLARTSDLVVAGLLLVFTALVAWFHVHLLQFFCDDSYISYRYSRHLVEGNGLVYNIGEYVEGYTNFLWVILVAAGMWMGFGAEGFSLACGLVLLGVALGVVFVAGRRLLGFRNSFAMATCALLVCLGPVILWSVAGLETIFFAAAVILAFLAYERALGPAAGRKGRFLVAGALYAISTMVRPDGVVFGAAAGLHLIVTELLAMRRGDGTLRRALTRASALAGGFLVVFLPFVTWRYLYYQDWLPNTFYVKAGSSIGFYLGRNYVEAFYREYPALVWLVALGTVLGFALPRYRAQRRTLGHAVLAIGLFLLYLGWAGGDYMALYRFLVPTLTLAALLAIVPLHALLGGLASGRGAPIAGLALLLSVGGLGYLCYQPSIRSMTVPQGASDEDGPEVVAPAWRMKRNTVVWKAAGLQLRERVKTDVMLATTAAGALPYFAQHYTIDQSGLCDRYTAKVMSDPWLMDRPGHMKQATRAYLAKRQPELILWHPWVRPVQMLTTGPAATPINVLPPSDQYQQMAWRIEELCVPGEPNWYLYLWVRHDWLPEARRIGFVSLQDVR